MPRRTLEWWERRLVREWEPDDDVLEPAARDMSWLDEYDPTAPTEGQRYFHPEEQM